MEYLRIIRSVIGSDLQCFTKLNVIVCTYTVGPTLISSRPSWQRGDQTISPPLETYDPDEESEVGSSVLAMMYTYRVQRSVTPTPHNLPFLQQDSSLVRYVSLLHTT